MKRTGNGFAAKMIDAVTAANLAHTHDARNRHLELCIPRVPVYDRDPEQYYFFRVVEEPPTRVGGDEIIAVRKLDGNVTHCGMVGE